MRLPLLIVSCHDAPSNAVNLFLRKLLLYSNCGSMSLFTKLLFAIEEELCALGVVSGFDAAFGLIEISSKESVLKPSDVLNKRKEFIFQVSNNDEVRLFV